MPSLSIGTHDAPANSTTYIGQRTNLRNRRTIIYAELANRHAVFQSAFLNAEWQIIRLKYLCFRIFVLRLLQIFIALRKQAIQSWTCHPQLMTHFNVFYVSPQNIKFNPWAHTNVKYSYYTVYINYYIFVVLVRDTLMITQV